MTTGLNESRVTCLEGYRVADADLCRLRNVPRGNHDGARAADVHRDRVGRARVVEHRDRGAGVERGADSHCLRPFRAVPLFKLDVMIMMRLIRLFIFIMLVTYLRNSLAVVLLHQQEVPRECCHEDLV